MRFLAGLLVGMCLSHATSAQTLFDSGEPDKAARLALGGGYYCEQDSIPAEYCVHYNAVGLVFDQDTVITGVQAYLSSVNQGVSYNPIEGVVDIVLYDGEWQQLQKTQFLMQAQQAGWRGVSGIDWRVDDGSYWISIEVPSDSKFTGGWFIDAPQPASYAATYDGVSQAWRSVTPTTLAARVTGFTSTLSSDLNRDGVVTVADLDALVVGMGAGSTDLFYDVTGDSFVDVADWITVAAEAGLSAGDANTDGVFDTVDVISLFQAGEYDDDIIANSRWSEGDFTGDLEFDSSDLIAALVTGNYQSGTGAAVTVPEPTSVLLFGLGCLCLFVRK